MTKDKRENEQIIRELEGRYNRDGYRSLLARVADQRDDLVLRFLAWRSQNPGGLLESALKSFEVETFGCEAYPAAHGMLLFAVLEESRKKSPMESA